MELCLCAYKPPNKAHLTLGILRQSQAVFYALAFFWLDGFAVPAPAQVTQAVRRPWQGDCPSFSRLRCGESRFWKARRAGSVMPVPVVQGVVRMPVVLEVRSGQRDYRWTWFRLKLVVQRVISHARDPDRTPVVPVWSAYTSGNLERRLRSPNTPLQPY